MVNYFSRDLPATDANFVLTKVKINNFRSCHDVVLEDIQGLTVLSGRNGAGKTNILKAIEWAARFATLAPTESGSKLSDVTNSVELNIEVENSKFSYLVESNLRMVDSGDQEIRILEVLTEHGGSSNEILKRRDDLIFLAGHSEPVKVDSKVAAIPAALALLPDYSFAEKLSAVQSFLRNIKYYPLDEPGNPTFSSVVPYSELLNPTDKNPSTRRDSVMAQLLRLATERNGDYLELKALLGPQGLNLIDDIFLTYLPVPSSANSSLRSGLVGPDLLKLRSEAANLFIFCAFELPKAIEGEPLTFYNDLSFGTRRLIRLFTHLMFDNASVMLIEQPEDGIHPGLLHKVVPQLRAYSEHRQFILASHSADIFNRLTPEEVRLVQWEATGSTLRGLSALEMKGAKDYLSADGSLSDFIRLVES